MTLYLKYRPRTIDELDQASVREKIKALALNRDIPHGFLLQGPKGTGKTSAARLLAKIVNCEHLSKDGEPCNRCSQCISINSAQNLDVIELDAASNRGIDDIRSLRQEVLLSPSEAKKKVYIFDEAHMLTAEAANAFLKTLEEPPPHVIFILATTDPEKLPSTIRSRLTNINFKKATADEIKRQLSRVAKAEKIKLDDQVIKLIAQKADGSFRDAIKILEDLALDNPEITSEKVATYFSGENNANAESFVQLLLAKEQAEALALVNQLNEADTPIKPFIDAAILGLRNNLLKDGYDQSLLELINLLIEARSRLVQSPIESLPLEIAILKWCKKKAQKSEPSQELSLPPVKKLNTVTWSKIMAELRTKNASVESLLRAAKPRGFHDQNLEIDVYYRFHKERLEVGENMLLVESVARDILGQKIKLIYRLSTRQQNETKPDQSGLTAAKDNDIISAAKEIFGT